MNRYDLPCANQTGLAGTFTILLRWFSQLSLHLQMIIPLKPLKTSISWGFQKMFPHFPLISIDIPITVILGLDFQALQASPGGPDWPKSQSFMVGPLVTRTRGKCQTRSLVTRKWNWVCQKSHGDWLSTKMKPGTQQLHFWNGCVDERCFFVQENHQNWSPSSGIDWAQKDGVSLRIQTLVLTPNVAITLIWILYWQIDSNSSRS